LPKGRLSTSVAEEMEHRSKNFVRSARSRGFPVAGSSTGESRPGTLSCSRTCSCSTEEWVIAERGHEALITKEEARKIAEARRSFGGKKQFNAGASRSRTSRYLLSGGLFRCGRCGANMIGFPYGRSVLLRVREPALSEWNGLRPWRVRASGSGRI
jgi:hypothetical protein